jgi:hypothetical protein
MEKKPVSHVVSGVIIGLVLILFFLAFYFTGNAFTKSALTYLPTLFFVIGIIYSILQYSKAMQHNVTYGNCFSYGFKTTAIVAIIMAIFLAVFIYAFPDYKASFMQFMTDEMEKSNSNISDEQQEKGIEMMGKFFAISAIGGGLFMNLLLGAIASLIGAAVAKKNPQGPFVQQG